MAEDVGLGEYFVCGGVGGLYAVLIGHPFDTVKVRLQTQGTLYRGMLHCFAKTIRHEGVFGLYKGMTAPMVSIIPIFAVSFWGYKFFKNLFGIKRAEDYRLYQYFIAGGCSAIATTVVMTPGERVKCLLQIQSNSMVKMYNGPIDCLRKLYREGGIRNIYRGSGATIAREIPASGGYFTTYEFIKNYFTNYGAREPNTLEALFAGGMAGVIFWMIALPVDVVKSRYQTAPLGKYTGAIQVFFELIRNEGPKALWSGIAPVICRSFPANAAAFLGFEMTSGLFRRLYAYLDARRNK